MAFHGQTDAPDETAMTSGAACDGPQYDFAATLAANAARDAAAASGGGGGAAAASLGADASSSDSPDSEYFDKNEFAETAWPWLVAAFVGSFALGIALLWAFRVHAHAMVWGVVYAKVAILGAVAVAIGMSGALVFSLFLAALTALTAFCYYLWRDELNLVASMLSVSTQGLNDNPHIVTATISLQLGTLFYLLPAAYFMAAAQQNGVVGVSSVAVSRSGSKCVDYGGGAVDCCDFNTDAWAIAFISLASITAIWVICMALETRVYLVGGVICQWYFAPAGTKNAGAVGEVLANAAGPSFGTIAFGSFVLTMIEILKQANENNRRKRENQNILACLLFTCLECIYAFVEYLSKFATLQAAMTGQAFCDAATSVTDLLKRNFLSAYATYFFPARILQFTTFVVAGAFGIAGWLLSLASYTAAGTTNGAMYAKVIGGVCFVVSVVVLSFFVMVVLNVVDAVFLCYAMDKDRNTRSHVEFHEVFETVNAKQQPKDETVVVGPDGGYKYASV
jgi:hypothetical protein